MKPLTLDEVEYVVHSLVKEMMDFDEPPSDFSTRYPNKLESCLEQPFATYDGVELYPTLLEKAILHFYLVIKNHPFENGNKRMAVVLMLYFLFENGKFMNVHPDELYKIAVEVAKSERKIDIELEVLSKVFTPFIVDRDSD